MLHHTLRRHYNNKGLASVLGWQIFACYSSMIYKLFLHHSRTGSCLLLTTVLMSLACNVTDKLWWRMTHFRLFLFNHDGWHVWDRKCWFHALRAVHDFTYSLCLPVTERVGDQTTFMDWWLGWFAWMSRTASSRPYLMMTYGRGDLLARYHTLTINDS